MRGYRSRRELSKANDYWILIGGRLCHRIYEYSNWKEAKKLEQKAKDEKNLRE